jgi:hypothetical protein
MAQFDPERSSSTHATWPGIDFGHPPLGLDCHQDMEFLSSLRRGRGRPSVSNELTDSLQPLAK